MIDAMNLVERIAPLLEELETGQDCAEYAYAKGKGFQAMTYCPEAFEALKELPETVTALQERANALALQADEWEGKYKIVSDMNASLRKQLADARSEALEEAAARVGELFGIDNHVCDAIRALKGKS